MNTIINNRKKYRKLQKRIINEGDIKKFGHGELTYSYGYPILKLRGSYYSMGLQYGVLLRREIRALYRENNGRKTEVINALPWYLRPFSGFFTALVAGFSFFRIPVKYRNELSALSRGSGVSFIDMATTAFGGVVFDAACTSVLSAGQHGIIHAQNLDFEPAYLGEYPVIVEYSHPRKLKYMHLGIAGIPGIFHGVNEKGISVTINYGDGTYNIKNRGLPMGYKLRDILERAENLDDVAVILRGKGPDEPGWIITAASASENCGAVFDVFNHEIVRSNFSGDKTEFILNNIFSPERTGNTELSKKYLHVSRGEGIYNLARESRIAEYLKTKKIDSVDAMIDFLRDYDFYGYKKFCGSLNATIVNERTLHTVIFESSEKSVYLSSAEGYSALSGIMKFESAEGVMTSYMEPAPEFDSKEMREFMDWYCSYQDAVIISTVSKAVSGRFRFVKFREHDFSGVIQKCPSGSCRNPREVWSLFRIWKRDRSSVNPGDIILSCNSLIEKYPDFAMLYIIKGNIEKSLRQYHDASVSYEKALSCTIISGYDRIHILNDLVFLYRKTGMADKALKYTEMNVALIESFSEKYLPGHKVDVILDKMKSLLMQQEN